MLFSSVIILPHKLGTDAEREAFKRDKARYDEASRNFWENAGDTYTKMRTLETCDKCRLDAWAAAKGCEHETSEQREDRQVFSAVLLRNS